MQPKQATLPNSAFTLVELLTVVAILAIVAAILVPVFVRAKESAKQTSCTSNLRQATTALNLYVEDHGEYPARTMPGTNGEVGQFVVRATAPIAPYHSSLTNLLVCPLDKATGRQLGPLDRVIRRSFQQTWYLWEGDQGLKAWKELVTLDASPVLYRCNFHEKRVRDYLLSRSGQILFGSAEHGAGLAARADGSVFLDKKSHFYQLANGNSLEDVKQMFWSQASSATCPPSVCDGLQPERVREY